MSVDVGLISLYDAIAEFSGSVSVPGNGTASKQFTFANASPSFDAYYFGDNSLSVNVTVSGTTVTLTFKNNASTTVSSSFTVRLGFTG